MHKKNYKKWKKRILVFIKKSVNWKIKLMKLDSKLNKKNWEKSQWIVLFNYINLVFYNIHHFFNLKINKTEEIEVASKTISEAKGEV